MKLIVSFSGIIILLLSCTQKENTLFIIHENLGNQFENKLTYTQEFNPYTYRNLRALEKGISFFWGGGCPKFGFWSFPSKSTFYPINKIPKEQMRCAPPVTSFSVRDPNRSVLKKSPKNTKSCQMVPRT